MKYKNIKAIVILFAGLFLTVSCSEEFLNPDPNGLALEDTYYSNETEAFAGVTAVYDVLGWENLLGRIVGLNSASDDFFAGGGNSSDITELQLWDNYTLNPTNSPSGEYWKKGFSGVFRANILLTKLPDVPMDENTKARFTAETKALRAYFYFDLVRFFKNIPLITTPVSTEDYYKIPQVAPEEVYAQIEADLNAAIPNLPITVPAATEGGRLTQGAAKALLGKVYLFQNKYTEAAAQFAEVNGTPGATSQYGYKLLDNFADLWEVENRFHSESILEIVHSKLSNGSWDNVAGSEGNIMNQMIGPRGYTTKTPDAPDYVSGYGFNPLSADLYNAYSATDLRRSATVANLTQLVADGKATYEPGYKDTGYFLEKFVGRISNRYPTGTAELNWSQDTYEIRLADTYLMEAEAIVKGGGNTARAQALLDAVRLRAGLTSIPATDENIFNERRLELAGEGQRWFDLVRTGRAAAVLAPFGFVAGKHEILPIPQLELNNTLLKQNPNY